MAVTAAEVRLIMNVSEVTLPDATITPFLTVAGNLVDTVFEDDDVLSDSILEQIEKWLTAHLIADTILRNTSKEKLGDAEVTYATPQVYVGVSSKILASTPYGRMVLLLDTTGKMGNLGKSKATIFAVKSFE